MLIEFDKVLLLKIYISSLQKYINKLYEFINSKSPSLCVQPSPKVDHIGMMR